MLALIGAAVLVLVVMAVLAKRSTSGAGAPDDSRAAAPHSVTGELNNRQSAQFEVASGAESVTIRGVDLGSLLYRVDTPPQGKVTPTVTDDGTRVQLKLAGTAIAGQATVEVQLNTKVLWQLRLAGGGLHQTVDFRTGRLAGIEIAAGAGEVNLTVPKPEGTLPIKLSGGAGLLAIHAPAGSPAQVRLGAVGGAGTVTIDGTTQQSLSPGSVLTPPGWATAKDRYDIEATAGVATLTFDRY
jgi:hypothetical protein